MPPGCTACRECEQYAQDMVKKAKIDFNTPEEKEAVAEVFNSAIQASATHSGVVSVCGEEGRTVAACGEG